MAYRVMVGTTGDWNALPMGTEWLGWKQQRKSKLVQVPLSHGALEVSDTNWGPMTVRVRVQLYDTTQSALLTAIRAVYRLLMEYQTAGSGTSYYIGVENDDPSSTMVFLVQYDRVTGMDVVMSKGTRHRHCHATFTLACTSEPYMNMTRDFDGT